MKKPKWISISQYAKLEDITLQGAYKRYNNSLTEDRKREVKKSKDTTRLYKQVLVDMEDYDV